MDWFHAEFNLGIDGAGVTADLPYWIAPVLGSLEVSAWNGTLPRWEVVEFASPTLLAALAWSSLQDGWHCGDATIAPGNLGNWPDGSQPPSRKLSPVAMGRAFGLGNNRFFQDESVWPVVDGRWAASGWGSLG